MRTYVHEHILLTVVKVGKESAMPITMQTWCAVIQQLYLTHRLLAYQAPAVRASRATAASVAATA